MLASGHGKNGPGRVPVIWGCVDEQIHPGILNHFAKVILQCGGRVESFAELLCRRLALAFHHVTQMSQLHVVRLVRDGRNECPQSSPQAGDRHMDPFVCANDATVTSGGHAKRSHAQADGSGAFGCLAEESASADLHYLYS